MDPTLRLPSAQVRDLPMFLDYVRIGDPPVVSTTVTVTTGACTVWLGGMPAGSVAVATSELAADKLTPDALDKRRRLVLAWFQSRGEQGGTADECCAALSPDGDHNTYAPRCSELIGMGFLDRTTERRKTRKGGTAFVLRVRTRREP